MTVTLHKSLLLPAGIGFAVFAGLHVFFLMTWDRLFSWGGIHEAWWLNSGESVAVTLGTLFFAALAALSISGAPLLGAVPMWIGVLVAMPIMLETVPGDHNLYPIVLVMGGVMTGIAILLGMVAAVGLTKLVTAFNKQSR